MEEMLGARIALVALELELAAPRERVWKALVAETHLWWPKDFHVRESARGMVFEDRLGGRLFEDWGDGAGVIWGTVFALDRGRSFDLSMLATLAFGGPRTSMLHVELEDEGARTRVRLSDSILGRIDEAGAAAVRAGWSLLLDSGLKPFVER